MNWGWVLLGPLVAVILTSVYGWLFLPATERLTAGWARFVTLGAAPADRDEKRARMAEFRHELLAAARDDGLQPKERAPMLAWAVVRGMPADLAWWATHVGQRVWRTEWAGILLRRASLIVLTGAYVTSVVSRVYLLMIGEARLTDLDTVSTLLLGALVTLGLIRMWVKEMSRSRLPSRVPRRPHAPE